MKKNGLLICLFLVFFLLTSCGGTTQQPATSTTTTGAAVGTNPSNTFVPSTNVEYTKEYSYLPAFPGMKLYNGGGAADDQGYKTAMYIINGAQSTEVLDNYEKLLNFNGWQTTTKNPPSFVVEKDGHRTIIATVQQDKDTFVTVVSK